MGIGVEEPVAHQLLQVAGGPLLGHGSGIDPGLHEGGPVGDLDAGHVVEAEHPAGTQLPHHRWDADAGIIEELLAEAGGMLGLQPEIQFPQQHTPALLGDSHPVAATAPAGMALHRARHLLEHLQIEAKQGLKTGPLNLEHHLPAAAEAGAVHLGQAGGAERFQLKIDDLKAALPEFIGEDPLHHRKWEGGHPVLQVGELLHHLGGEDIGSGREDLAELDEGRAQAEEFRGEPAGLSAATHRQPFGAPAFGVAPAAAVPPEAHQQLDHHPPDAQGPAEAGAPRESRGGGHQAFGPGPWLEEAAAPAAPRAEPSSRRRASWATWARRASIASCGSSWADPRKGPAPP